MGEWILFGFIAFVVFMLVIHFWIEGHQRSEITRKYGDTEEGKAILNKQVFVGMSQWQLRDSWGDPKSKSVRALKTKTKETWIYDAANHIYLEDGHVVGWKQRS